MAGRFVGLVVDADGLRTTEEQSRRLSSSSTAGIELRELAPRTQEDWHYGIAGVIDELGQDDVLAVTSLAALGLTSDDLVDRIGRLAARGAQLLALDEDIDSLVDPGFLGAITTLAHVLEAGRDARTRAALTKYRDVHAATPPRARFVDADSYERVSR